MSSGWVLSYGESVSIRGGVRYSNLGWKVRRKAFVFVSGKESLERITNKREFIIRSEHLSPFIRFKVDQPFQVIGRKFANVWNY